MAALDPQTHRREALAGLRAALVTEHRAATEAAFVPSGERLIRTGVPGLDAALGGGVPRGIIATLEGASTSGRCTVVARLLAVATSQGLAALIQSDDTGTLYPPALEAAGVALERLLVVPAREPLGVARAADILLRSGAFTVVAIPAVVLKAAVWTRLAALAHRANALLLALGTQASNELGYFASLRVRMTLDRVRWNGGTGQFATLAGYDVRADVVKAKRSIPHVSAFVTCASFERRGPRLANIRERSLAGADADRLRARSIL